MLRVELQGMDQLENMLRWHDGIGASVDEAKEQIAYQAAQEYMEQLQQALLGGRLDTIVSESGSTSPQELAEHLVIRRDMDGSYFVGIDPSAVLSNGESAARVAAIAEFGSPTQAPKPLFSRALDTLGEGDLPQTRTGEKIAEALS